MYNSVALILLVGILTVQSNSQFHRLPRIDLEGLSCVTVQNGENVNGTCSTIHNCPSILANVLNKIYNHTKCKLKGARPIFCCPNDGTQLPKTKKLNLGGNLECKVVNSNETGVIKFLSHCPVLNTNDIAAEHINKLCDYDICRDLVCCPPGTLKNRLKNICLKVDHPLETLTLRLSSRFGECTIKELNMTGRYQRFCDYAKRNPGVAPLLQNVCNDDACLNWYCCPPIEQTDKCAGISNSRHVEFVGPKCIDSTSGRQGTCRSKYLNHFQPTNNSRLDKCGSHCCIDYYCIPDDQNVEETVNISVSAKACLSFASYVKKKKIIEVPMDLVSNDCYSETQSDTKYREVRNAYGSGRSDIVSYVAGGRPTDPGNFPHMAALGYELNQQIFWKCGGSLISDRYVLTAAHCLSNPIGPVKKVRLGIIDLLNDVTTFDCPEEYGVIQQIPHPEYTPLHAYNDIGLIELDGQVKFNYHIRPICLPLNAATPDHFQSMGWGDIGHNTQETSVKLLNVFQTLFSNEECNELYQHYPSRKLNKGILNETQICAGSRFSIQSTCNGDSGGPLQGLDLDGTKMFQIYGIVSTGTACGFANSPGVYTKVYPYVNWIEKLVWGI